MSLRKPELIALIIASLDPQWNTESHKQVRRGGPQDGSSAGKSQSGGVYWRKDETLGEGEDDPDSNRAEETEAVREERRRQWLERWPLRVSQELNEDNVECSPQYLHYLDNSQWLEDVASCSGVSTRRHLLERRLHRLCVHTSCCMVGCKRSGSPIKVEGTRRLVAPWVAHGTSRFPFLRNHA